MTAPRTAAGRALLEAYEAADRPLARTVNFRNGIVAIEAEADRSLLLDAALRALVAAMDDTERLAKEQGIYSLLSDAEIQARDAARAALKAVGE